MIGAVDIASELPAESFAEEKFRLAVEACPNGMVMTDGNGSIVLVNSATEQLFGYRRDELIGRHVGILIPPRLHAEYFKERAAYLSRPRTARFDVGRNFFAVRRDGSEFPVEIDLNPIRNRESPLVLSVIVDVSERKRLERLKDEFVSTVSHELRTPLTSIAASLGLLVGGAGGELPAKAARLIGIAESNSRRLVRLINDLLDVEKIESGRILFRYRRIDARALAVQVIEANRGYADSLHIRTTLDAAAAGEVYSDPDRLAQVLTNLLSNALKFSPVNNEVAIAIESRGDDVRISVRDHGPGIPSEFRPHIFEKFAQARTADVQQKGGSGLGLSIVKEIVSRLGGNVGFRDADGGGTVFYVELPSWSCITARRSDADAAADAVRILLCENDPEAALALRDGLRPFGFGTDFAFDPADAVARVYARPYAAILIDLDFTDGESIKLIRDLRQQPHIYNTPIVAILDNGSADDGTVEAFNLKVAACVEKPVDIGQLAQALGRAVTHGGNGRPKILHVDDDHQVLKLVARALGSFANVVSVDSIEQARSALMLHRFDLVILDIGLGAASGLDLLPELHDRTGAGIPVVVFSAHAGELDHPQVQASLNKASATLKDLVAVVHDRLRLKALECRKGVRMSAIRLLHVDDEPDIREVVAISLALDSDFAVQACASGAEAITAAPVWLPFLILLDVVMPGMDGPATLAQLRRSPQSGDIPVLFMTARAQTREIEQLIALGAQGVIAKPFDPMRLAGLVRSHLQTVSLRTLRAIFIRRARGDGARLKQCRCRLAESADAAAIGELRQIASDLADAAEFVGFDQVEGAARAVEHTTNGSAKSQFADALDRLIVRLDNEWKEPSAAVA